MSKTTTITNEVTQKDLHDLLEIFERKSFEAGSCEEGSLVSFSFFYFIFHAFRCCFCLLENAANENLFVNVGFFYFALDGISSFTHTLSYTYNSVLPFG